MAFDHPGEAVAVARPVPQSHTDEPLAVIFVEPVALHFRFVTLENPFLQ